MILKLIGERMDKEIFLDFKNSHLSNFNNILKNILHNKFLLIDQMHYENEYVDYKQSIIDESERSGREPLKIFKEKTDIHCMNAFLKTKDWVSYVKGKFQAEMELIETLLDNNKEFIVLNNRDSIQKNIKYILKNATSGFGDIEKLPVLIFSERKQKEFLKLVNNTNHIFKKVSKYEDLTMDMFSLLSENIVNEFSNSVAAEDIYNPLYENYFKNISNLLGSKDLLSKMKILNKENISEIEGEFHGMNRHLEEILSNLNENLETTVFNRGSTSIELRSCNLKNKAIKSFTPIIGDFPTEFVSMYTAKCIQNDIPKISQRYISGNEEIDSYFEEYNVYMIDNNFQYGLRKKDFGVSFINRYWGDSELLEQLRLNNLFAEKEIEVKIIMLKQQLFSITNTFRDYASDNTALLSEVEKTKKILTETISEFNSVEEMIKILFYEDGELILSDSNLVTQLYKQYYEYLAKKEGKSLLSLAMSKSPFINREFIINDINIAFINLGANEMNMWDVRDKVDYFKRTKITTLGVEVYLYKREALSDSLVISIHKDMIDLDITNKELIDKFYENIITYIWSSKIKEEEVYERVRQCILEAKLSLLKGNDTSSHIKKKI